MFTVGVWEVAHEYELELAAVCVDAPTMADTLQQSQTGKAVDFSCGTSLSTHTVGESSVLHGCSVCKQRRRL